MMTGDALGVVIFIVGICIQALPTIRKRLKSASFIFALILPALFSLVAYFTSKDKGFSLAEALWLYALLFAPLLYLNFKREFIPVINEKIVLLFTVVFWYAFVSIMDKTSPTIKVLMPVAILFSLAVLISVVIKNTMPKFFKIILFIWYFVVVISISLTHLTSIAFWMLFSGNVAFMQFGGIVEYGIMGMFYMFFVTNLLPIVLLLPSRSNRMPEVREHIKLLIEKYADTQITWTEGLIFIISIVLIALLNAKFALLSAIVLIDIMLLGIPKIVSWLERKSTIQEVQE